MYVAIYFLSIFNYCSVVCICFCFNFYSFNCSLFHIFFCFILFCFAVVIVFVLFYLKLFSILCKLFGSSLSCFINFHNFLFCIYSSTLFFIPYLFLHSFFFNYLFILIFFYYEIIISYVELSRKVIFSCLLIISRSMVAVNRLWVPTVTVGWI